MPGLILVKRESVPAVNTLWEIKYKPIRKTMIKPVLKAMRMHVERPIKVGTELGPCIHLHKHLSISVLGMLMSVCVHVRCTLVPSGLFKCIKDSGHC